MLCIQSNTTDPYLNLATEEYFLRHSDAGVFMLWQSDPVVVTGKHQNVLAEINYRYVRDRGIRVARRLTGGGTVFQDAGNVNFTFIRAGEPGRLVDFTGFIETVTQFLDTLGIVAQRGAKNEIMAYGKKISGNAEHVYKNRVLHHGTLLIQSNLDMLRESIRPAGGKYTDKAVQSNRSHVMNLADRMQPRLTPGEFRDVMMDFMIKRFGGSLFKPDAGMEVAIGKLAREKYAAWDWVFGWSPDYTFQNKWLISTLGITIFLSVHRGIIQQCILQTDHDAASMLLAAGEVLHGKPHRESDVRDALMQSGIHKLLKGNEFEELVLAFF